MMSSQVYCDRCGAPNRPQASFCSNCGQSLGHIVKSQTTTGLLVGQNAVLNRRYRILELLGRGGFGAVYKVADVQLGHRLLAIKEMSQGGLNPQELAAATTDFKREAFMLANLSHPNLPRIYEQFQERGRWYLVMDFIEGKTLEDLLDGGRRYPLEKALAIGLQLCSVLDYLHTRQPPIIFRDLKPANIMLTPGGHVHLIDFGIARHFKPGQTKDTTALGSSGYAAPEQYGKTQTTPRSDIYSLGVTLHQALSGHDPSISPFHFAPLQLGNHPALTELETLIQHMLEIDSSKRPPTVAAVAQKLQALSNQYAFIQTQPLPAPLPPGYQSAMSASAPKLPSLAARPQAPAHPQPPRNRVYTCSGHSGRITAVAWSPYGPSSASGSGYRLTTASYDKTVRIWYAANGSSLLVYRGHFERVNAVAWSPNGTRIASASDDRTVQIWDATSGKQLLIFKGHSEKVTALAWSPDGLRIASASMDKTAQVWDSATGRTLFVQRGHSDGVAAVSWSPDGRYVVSGGLDKMVHVWEWTKDSRRNFFTSFLFSDRSARTYRGHSQRINAVAWSPNGRLIASASGDKTIHVWDPSNGKTTLTYRNVGGATNALTWAPDSRRIAAASNDKTVQVWDVMTPNLLSAYHGHSSYVMGVAWAPDGKRIASVSVDRTLQVWTI